METKHKKEEAHRRIQIDGFNVVESYFTPEGDLIITLSHRATNDGDVMFRVVADDDVELCGAIDNVDWEDAGTRVGRINKGGNWHGQAA